MKIINKNEIYVKMLILAIPYIRSIQSHKGRTDRSCYHEAKLVHNLAYTILTPDFEDHDLYFLNHQARYYIENCSDEISPNYNGHKALIISLFDIVPENMKHKLAWDISE
nr:zinc ABC transporter substrate-binding protein [Pectobacterium versatile]